MESSGSSCGANLMQMRTVQIVPYQPDWPAAFRAEQQALMAALDGPVIGLHHIGSTAVPGLAAKPILDLLLVVTDLALLDAQSASLTALGYVAKGENGIPGRRYFCKGGAQRSHHLHAFTPQAPQILQHLAFRDCLRNHPETATAYAALKTQLARQYPQDPARYQAGKAEFIQQLLQQTGLLPDAQYEDKGGNHCIAAQSPG
jgi:GrpB-like predicted nucleotidyltransferase (UPF0157 family)